MNSSCAEKCSSCLFPQKSIIFLGPRTIVSRSLKKNNWHRSQRCEILVQRNNLVIFLNETFFQSCTSSGKRPDFERNFSNKSLDLSIFVFRGQFGFFPRDLGFFGLWAQTFELRQKNNQQCFQKCIQGVEENVLVIFWLLEFFYWNLSIFCRRLSKTNPGSFLNTAKYVCRIKFWYFFPKENFFQFCTLSWKL